jgi:hypothetical protein
MTPVTFTTDGITATYPAGVKFRPETTLVFLGGIYQGLGEDYTEGAALTSITFKVIPPAGLKGEIRFVNERVLVAPAGSGTFKDQLAADAVNIFLNNNEFAEEIVYTPKGGTAKTIKAIVDREQLFPAGEDSGRVLQNQVKISIATDTTYGIGTINLGGDTVDLPERIGGADVNWRIVDVLNQDEGLWTLLAQK